ncbi:MAG TPA: DUF4870 domain-containing protein [Chloroflexia bacterium]|nr:DUF4870 domain-containing protein [Chloroflexia bacterium]
MPSGGERGGGPGGPWSPPGGDPYLVPPSVPRRPPVQALGGRAADAVLAATAHASIVLGLFGVGFLVTLLVSIVIWLYGKRSPYVAYHARQAGCYQCFVLAFNTVYVFVLLLLWFFYLLYPQWDGVGNVLLGLLIPFVFWFIGSILYGVVAAIMVLLGRPFAYPVFGARAARAEHQRLAGPAGPPGMV